MTLDFIEKIHEIGGEEEKVPGRGENEGNSKKRKKRIVLCKLQNQALRIERERESE